MTDRIFARALAAQRNGELDKSAQICRDILKCNPKSFEALYLLGFVLSQLQQLEEAERRIGEAIQLNPHSADAHYNRGCLLLRLERTEQALACFDAALAILPSYADARLNRGLALLKLGRPAHAMGEFKNVLRSSPNHIPALIGLGTAMGDQSRDESALTLFDRALALEPNNLLAAQARGAALLRMRRYEEAAAEFERVLARIPDSAETLSNRAAALFELKRISDAARDYGRALSLAPDLPFLRGHHMYCKLHACDWRDLANERAAIAAALRANRPAILPFANLALSSSAEEQSRCAEIAAISDPPSGSPLWRGERYHHDRIRIAYLSADFHAHATAHLAAGMFETHDRRRFETIAVSYGPDDKSTMRARLTSAFDRFIEARQKSDFEIALLLRELETDIAIDLKGRTKDSRCGILGWRPAPVQAHYLGYPGTIASQAIDYIIADRIVIPEEHRRFYSEAVAYLPDSYQCNVSAETAIAPARSRAEYGLPEAEFVFCCFSNNFKIQPELFTVWMRLLTRIPDSVLWLMADNPDAARNLVQAACELGVQPRRIIFAQRIGVAEHLARHRAADLFLDTMPYGAHTTASDALRAGVPLVTLLGDCFQGRVAASLLHAIGLPELIVRSPRDYEELAVAIAREPERLRAIKAKLAANSERYPLFDTVRFTRNFEAIMTGMWERQQRGEPPAGFAVGEAGQGLV